jgi:hypothetical protein
MSHTPLGFGIGEVASRLGLCQPGGFYSVTPRHHPCITEALLNYPRYSEGNMHLILIPLEIEQRLQYMFALFLACFVVFC